MQKVMMKAAFFLFILTGLIGCGGSSSAPERFHPLPPGEEHNISQVIVESGDPRAIAFLAEREDRITRRVIEFSETFISANWIEGRDVLNDVLTATACRGEVVVRTKRNSVGFPLEADDMIIACGGYGIKPVYTKVASDESAPVQPVATEAEPEIAAGGDVGSEAIVVEDSPVAEVSGDGSITSQSLYSFVSHEGDDLGYAIINNMGANVHINTAYPVSFCVAPVVQYPSTQSHNAKRVKGKVSQSDGVCGAMISFDLLDAIGTKQVVINLQTEYGPDNIKWYGRMIVERVGSIDDVDAAKRHIKSFEMVQRIDFQ